MNEPEEGRGGVRVEDQAGGVWVEGEVTLSELMPQTPKRVVARVARQASGDLGSP